MKKKKYTILFLGVFCVAAFGSAVYIVRLVRDDGRMIFPKTPHGTFIQTPKILTEDGVRRVEWVLSKMCARASYEVQEVGYATGSGMLWGGQDASCAQSEQGYRCLADLHSGMSGDSKRWMIQAYAYECDGGDYYISEPVVDSTLRF